MFECTYAYGLSVAFVLLILSYVRSLFSRGLDSLPGPVLARVSGLYRLSLVYRGDAPERYRLLHQQYGSIVRTGPYHVSVSDPLMIPAIYGVGSRFVKTPFYTTMSPTYQSASLHSLFTTRDPADHRALKAPVAQLLSMTNMKNYEKHADECTAIFIEAMRDLQGKSIDIAVWLQWYAFDVIGMITFQRRFGFMEQRRDVDQMIAGLDKGLQYVKVVGQFPGWHRWLAGNVTLSSVISMVFSIPDTMRKFIKITEGEILKYETSHKQLGRTDFLAQLRERAEINGRISKRDEMNHLSNNLLAGSDTTAISLRACFYFLIKNPRVYHKLVAEIDEADRLGKLSAFMTYDESLKLPYLQAVIKEAMRMHPGVGFPLERLTPHGGETICGVQIPVGTIVSISAPVIHQDRNVFGEDASSFCPERWLDATAEQLKIMDRSFLAFGHGSRTCIGKNISLLEMGKFVPQVIRYFTMEWASPVPEWKVHTAWFSKQSGMVVRLRLRNNIEEER